MKNNPMGAFVGVDFDVQYQDMYGVWRAPKGDYLTSKIMDSPYNKNIGLKFRPRLNKAQVLEDYTPILVDGFVWEVKFLRLISRLKCREIMTSDELRGDGMSEKSVYVRSLAFKGVQQGYDLSQWALASDVPIYNSDMEVV